MHLTKIINIANSGKNKVVYHFYTCVYTALSCFGNLLKNMSIAAMRPVYTICSNMGFIAPRAESAIGASKGDNKKCF